MQLHLMLLLWRETIRIVLSVVALHSLCYLERVLNPRQRGGLCQLHSIQTWPSGTLAIKAEEALELHLHLAIMLSVNSMPTIINQ